ncbi:MAG: response regulator [Cyclobacteriaceae bacterium]|nr:response regulator [Cyclobacteriaceae bacterium HetDA_MAG_MS6]
MSNASTPVLDEGLILVVDDNPTNIQVLGNHLKAQGLRFEFALDGQAALKWLSKKPFDLVLLDVLMPNMDGFETIQKIRENDSWKDIPVIFLSAKTEFESLLQGFELGSQDYITKPFHPKELVSRVKAQMALRQNQKLLQNFSDQLQSEVMDRTQALRKSELELRDANATLTSIINNLPGVVFRRKVDEGFTMLFVSPQFTGLTGYDVEEVISGRLSLLHLVYEKDRRLILEERERFIREGHQHYELRYRLIRKDGTIIWVQANGNYRVLDEGSSKTLLAEGLLFDITERAELDEHIRTSNLRVADQERNYVARELHDGVQQVLATASLSFQGILQKVSALTDDVEDRFKTGLELLNSGLEEIREISHRLVPRSVEAFGLAVSIRNLVEHQNAPGKVVFSFNENTGEARFDPQLELNIYRIVQEACTNIMKYAEAENAMIQLFLHENLLTLSIEDDGKGFEIRDVQNKKGFGLISMESRATASGGYFEVSSQARKGTQILVEFTI